MTQLNSEGISMKSQWFRLAITGLFILAVSGCAAKPGRISTELPGRYLPLTLPIIAVGDTQEHEATGFPLHQEDGAVDSYVEVAQRPPEQPLFGRRILEWVIEKHPDMPMIHLGDLLDMSCRSELNRMRKVIEIAQQPGAILPGNHDGLLFGIFNHDIITDYLHGDGLEWQRGCRPGSQTDTAKVSPDGRGPGLSKREYLEKYLERLAVGPQPQAGLKPVEGDDDIRVQWVNPNPEGFIERLDANLVSGRNYAKSYLLQKLRLPPAPGAPRRATIVAIDTSQLNVLVGLFNMISGDSPGDTGRVMPDQTKIIETYVKEARSAGEIVIFAGHHSWAQLDAGSRRRLAGIMEQVDHPLIYISAHTHEGSWAMYRLDQRELLELNVSSLSDWPIAYRRISFAYDPEANRLQFTADLMPMLNAPPRDDQQLLDAWVQQSCSQAGVSVEKISRRELAIVKAQRDSRGTLVDWLFEGFADVSDSARMTVYESAHHYQDGLIDVITSTYADLGDQVPEMARISPPSFCAGQSVQNCGASLRTAQYHDLPSAIELFRKKAAFVDTVGEQLDDIKDPKAKGYMTCRAALAAKDDFDMTPEANRPGGFEERRRTSDFFRVEATVGVNSPPSGSTAP
jgi:hypothetical protein